MTSIKTLLARMFDESGNLKTALQDQTTPILSLYFHRHLGDITLAGDHAIGDTIVSLAPGHGSNVGELVCFKEDARYYQGIILAVNVDDITLDTPLDYAYTAAGGCSRTSKDMNVDGSVTPVIFHVKPTGVDWDATEVSFNIQDSTTMDDGTFGGIAAASVPRGLVLRKKDSVYHNIFNIKTNGGFALRGSREYSDKPPAGTGHAVNANFSMGRPGPGGIVVRLSHEAGDELELIVSDDYTGLDVFDSLIHGHTTDPS